MQVFPEMTAIASHLQRATGRLRDEEVREDLKTQANMYCNTLTLQLSTRLCVSPSALLLSPWALLCIKLRMPGAQTVAGASPHASCTGSCRQLPITITNTDVQSAESSRCSLCYHCIEQ